MPSDGGAWGSSFVTWVIIDEANYIDHHYPLSYLCSWGQWWRRLRRENHSSNRPWSESRRIVVPCWWRYRCLNRYFIYVISFIFEVITNKKFNFGLQTTSEVESELAFEIFNLNYPTGLVNPSTVWNVQIRASTVQSGTGPVPQEGLMAQSLLIGGPEPFSVLSINSP